MAHYAFINKNSIVVEVITGRNETEIVDGISDWEKHYEQFRKGLKCLRTSFNTSGNKHSQGGIPFRGNYAAEGFKYDSKLDAFIPPQCHEEAILNEETCLWTCQNEAHDVIS